MQKRLNSFMLLLVIVAVVMTSAVRTTTVYADDGVTEPASEETTPADEEQPVTPVNEQPVVEEPASIPEIPDEAGDVEPPVLIDDGQPVVPVDEQPVVEEPISVPEILEQLPEGTELVAVNEDGDIEPLATEEAAEIIATADPMWCPEGATPGDVGCTGSFADFASLIAALTADATLITPVYTGNGVIWVEDTYNGNDDTQIIFDGATLTNLGNNNLTVQGGWSGGNNTTVTGTSLSDVSMVFVNWTGNITINDFDIAAGDDAGFGLSINNTRDVTLDNVSVNDTPLNSQGFGEGAVVNNTGDVDITNSEFNNNAGNGLIVESDGNIDLDTVSASNNTLTGAFLDSCHYGSVTPGLCAGNGGVTITGTGPSLFNNNGFIGLIIDAGGGLAIDNVQANTNALGGALLTSADDDGTGNVVVDQSEFNDNSNGTGLDILADGNIDLTNVDAFSNNTGAILDTTHATGAINISDSNFGVDNATGNTWTGLHAESGNTIDLTNVTASYNGTNGAYLEAEGDITVDNSTFNENVHFDFPEDPGLYAQSNGGDITLINVIADGNDYGAGAVLTTNNNGSVSVTGGQFNDNGTFGIQAQSKNGDITLDGVTASLNQVKGAYLKSHGLGNVFVNNSVFVENGSYGIYAYVAQGNINLDLVTVTGDNGVDDGAVGEDNLTDYGAVLTTQDGGNIFVGNSTFDLNTEVGLQIIASGPVDLVNVTADQNGGNGVEVYSVSTKDSICPDDEVVNIDVEVDGGSFTNNGGYGLMVKPGPQGTLIFINPSTFGGNGLGDYLLNLSEASRKDCEGKDKPVDSKGPKIVDVPLTGGTPVIQECDLFTGTILKLPNGTWIMVGCPFEGYSNLEDVTEDNLPGGIGAGTNFEVGISVGLTDEDGNMILNEDGTVTINFVIPEGSRGRGYSILFWDPTLNEGAGGWVTLPLYEFGTSFPLNPDDPEDSRTVISGVQQIGNTVTVTVNFPGVFVLTSR